jgi:hypothetical protein
VTTLARVPSRIQESERLLDAAIECTFPASDPVAVNIAFEAACEREVQMINDR